MQPRQTYCVKSRWFSDSDAFGSTTLTLQNRNGLGGALFQTQNTDSSVTLVDFGFMMTNGVQRNLRLEGRATYAKAGSPGFLLGGSNLTAPTLAVGDTYGAITSLAVGSYTTPGTNALSVTGTVSMPGYTFCSGMVEAAGTKQTSTGQVTYTSGLISTGVYSITFPTAHPIGNTYITNITGKGVVAIMQNTSPAPTTTTFQVQCYAVGTAAPTAGGFNFMVLAS